MTMTVAITDRKLMMAPLARWSSRIALFSASLVAVGVVLHHFTSFPTPVAINLFQVALAGAALAVLLGLVAVAQIWRRGHGGAVTAAVGIVVPFLVWAWPLTYVPALFSLPPINDVTTDIANPPRFVALAKQRPRDANPATYPGERFAKEQQKAYPDVRTFTVDRSVEESFELVEEVVRKLKWRVVAADPPAGGRAAKGGTLEATDQTLVVGFTDDVVVRVEGGGTQSRIDVRSASRYGVGDLGQNATRVRRFLTELYARLESTSPLGVAGRKRPASAALKRLKERDPQRAESRNAPGRARSDAQRGRGQKETQR
jgi:uncharacterized protein (DUF1499 family)